MILLIHATASGLIASTLVFIVIGLLMFNDGIFIRPHPAFWRVILASSAAYQLYLVYLLFQVGTCDHYRSKQMLSLYDRMWTMRADYLSTWIQS
jgi:hypothetical protein